MSAFIQKADCKYCKAVNTIFVSITQTKWSRTVKISKCEKCNEQSKIVDIINALSL